MARFVVAVAVFIFQNKRFLALRRSTSKRVAPGVWEVVSGKVKPGEAPYEAARRETYEETGMLVALDHRPITAYQATHPMVVLIYRGQSLSGEVIFPPMSLWKACRLGSAGRKTPEGQRENACGVRCVSLLSASLRLTLASFETALQK